MFSSESHEHVVLEELDYVSAEVRLAICDFTSTSSIIEQNTKIDGGVTS